MANLKQINLERIVLVEVDMARKTVALQWIRKLPISQTFKAQKLHFSNRTRFRVYF